MCIKTGKNSISTKLYFVFPTDSRISAGSSVCCRHHQQSCEHHRADPAPHEVSRQPDAGSDSSLRPSGDCTAGDTILLHQVRSVQE